MGGDQRRETVPGTADRLRRLALRLGFAVVIAGGVWLVTSAVDSGTASAAEQPPAGNTVSNPDATNSGLLGVLGGSVGSVFGTVNSTLDGALSSTVGTVNSVVTDLGTAVATVTTPVTSTVPVQLVLPVTPVIPVTPTPAPAPVAPATPPVVRSPAATPVLVTTPSRPVTPAAPARSVTKPRHLVVPRRVTVPIQPPVSAPAITVPGGMPKPNTPAPAPAPTPDLVAPVMVPAHNSASGAHRLPGVLPEYGTARLPVRWVTAAPRIGTATGGPLGLPSTSPD